MIALRTRSATKQPEVVTKQPVKLVTKTVLMQGERVIGTSSEQPSVLLRDENFGKAVNPMNIVLGKRLSAVGTTNAQRIDLLQVVSGLHNISNLYTRMYDPD